MFITNEDALAYLQQCEKIVIPSKFTYWCHSAQYKNGAESVNANSNKKTWDEMPFNGFDVKGEMSFLSTQDRLGFVARGKSFADAPISYNDHGQEPFQVKIAMPKKTLTKEEFEGLYKDESYQRQLKREYEGLGDMRHPKLPGKSKIHMFGYMTHDEMSGKEIKTLIGVREQDLLAYANEVQRELSELSKSGIVQDSKYEMPDVDDNIDYKRETFVMGDNEYQKVLGNQGFQKGKKKKLEAPKSCKEAYESIDFNNIASNKDLTDLVRAACFKESPSIDKTKLRQHLVGLVKGGANIYATQAQIMKEIRQSSASIFKGGGQIGLDSSQPETEQNRLRELARIDTYIGQLVLESPFENIFGQLEEMERLKAFKSSREKAGIYSQSDYLEDKIGQIKNGVEATCERFDPAVLSDVAESKEVVKNEDLLIEQGVKEQSSLIVDSVNNTTEAINDLRTIASRQQGRQNEENISYGRSH